jgi:DNA-binding GntR family transcriptional regulator
MVASIDFVKPELLRSRVEDHLRRAVVSGRLRAGERLVERELCELLGVSRPSLREALRRLEAEKLIVNVPHRGPVVATISLDEARDIYALRRLLEGFAAHECARRASEELVRKLAAAAKALRDAARRRSRDGVIEAKAEFYDALLEGCGNALVREALAGLLSRVSLLRSTSLMLPERLPRSVEEIEELVERIRKGDARGARRIAEGHVRRAEVAALGVLSRQRPDSASAAAAPSPSRSRVARSSTRTEAADASARPIAPRRRKSAVA